MTRVLYGGEMVDLEKQRGRPSGHQDVLNLERPSNSSSWPATGPPGMLCTQRLTRTQRSRVFAHNILQPYFIPSIKYCPVFEDKQKADKLVCPPHDRRNIFSVILLEKQIRMNWTVKGHEDKPFEFGSICDV